MSKAKLQYTRVKAEEAGFTLIELLVSTVIALVILGGLLLSFQSQYSEYKYQNKRVDAAQDLEFVMNFIAEDLQQALVVDPYGVPATDTPSNPPTDYDPVENNGFAGTAATTSLTFWVWDPVEAVDPNTKVVLRKYAYDPATENLGYDRMIGSRDVYGNVVAQADTSASNDILRNVTFFKVFKDDLTPRAVFQAVGASKTVNGGIPDPMAIRTLARYNPADPPNPTNVSVPSYTVLVEVAVDAGYKTGSFIDVLGNDQSPGVGDGRKRIWRYIQVQPRTTMP